MFPIQTLFLVQTLDHRPCYPCPAHVPHMSPLVPLVSLPVVLHAPLCLLAPISAISMIVLVLLAVAIGSRPLCPFPPCRLARWVFSSSWQWAQPAPSPFWRRRSACSHAGVQTYCANWSLASPRHEYKPPTGPWTGDDPTWSNDWAATGTHLDTIAKQYKKGTRTGLERVKNGFGKG